jgi:hypothetical protein
MKIITINYLAHNHNRSKSFWNITKYFLNLIKNENKSKIRVNILTTEEENWESLDDIETNVISFPAVDMNYMYKVSYASDQETEYSVKLDNDCFINNHLWDYMIENVHVLESEENLFVAPLLSNNIPLVDKFIESFVEDNAVKEKIYSYFLNRHMPNGLWGVDYSSLNEHTIQSDVWNSEKFYEGVSKINHYYKGIHPIRISAESQIILNDYILQNFEKIISKQNYSIEEFPCVYYTNSVFLIKTIQWKNILATQAYDPFDEVQFNIFKNKLNKKALYVKNGFSFHLTYNTIHNPSYNSWEIGMHNGKDYENQLSDKIWEKLSA